jgi:excinuclease ABC subunit C
MKVDEQRVADSSEGRAALREAPERSVHEGEAVTSPARSVSADDGASTSPKTQARLLQQAVAFDPADATASLSTLPEGCGLFALFAEDARAEPYLAKASHLRRRLQRFLRPAPTQTRRLQLAGRIRRIEYTETGSDFAADLAFYEAATKIESLHPAGGADRSAEKRLRLHPAAFLKLGMDNAFPRALITTRIGRSASAKSQPVGPFPSKAAAERYLEEVLNLFLLRRCLENLDPDPSHPGCAYSEMKKCLAPCYKGCTPERYQQEAEDVEQFLVTRGQSLLERVDRDRREASERLEFEQAAALHQRYLKIEAVAAQMPEAARALNALNGMIVQPGSAPDHVDLFSLERGALSGPVSYSTIGMRLHNELSGSSSLYTQPMALQAVPLAEDGTTAVMAKELPRDMLEARLDDALQVFAGSVPASTRRLQAHLSLFARWFYRPQTRRVGEVLFVNASGDAAGQLPKRALLRAISRVAASVQFGAGAPGQKAAQWHA